MNIIDQIFNDAMDGKECRVSCGGVYVQGSIEGSVILKYIKHHGLICFAKLEWNTNKLHDALKTILVDNREQLQLSYDMRDAIIDLITPAVKEYTVQVATISPYKIKNINCILDKEQLRVVNIVYENGTNCDISFLNQ